MITSYCLWQISQRGLQALPNPKTIPTGAYTVRRRYFIAAYRAVFMRPQSRFGTALGQQPSGRMGTSQTATESLIQAPGTYIGDNPWVRSRSLYGLDPVGEAMLP